MTLRLKPRLSIFKLHLARILASVVLNKGAYNHKDIESLDVSHLNLTNFGQAVGLLAKSIDSFRRIQDTNLINMSKTKSFTDHMIEAVKAELQQMKI